MRDLHEGWAEGLAREMAEQEMSPAKLAKACGVHQSTIKRILDVEMVPSDELKWKIAGALQKRMDEIWPWPRVIPPMPAVAA